MADLKKNRWAVTYTKHIKQKRKVYQDGFLEFHLSTNKIELYDDCQKLLGVKIAKEDDVIRSGETLAFNAYLVDIGDLEGGCKPMLNLNGQVRDKKVTEKAGLSHPKKKFSPVFVGGGKLNLEKNKAPSSCLSPSQKIIREFKKNEMLKYGGSANSPDATKPINSDWQVLYTNQKTQKAKKYHDGFLRVVACGSQRRQATLYDLSRRALDSKFLKKDEVIESGKSLAFDGHLVDVGDPEGDHKIALDIKLQDKSFFTENEKLSAGNSISQLNGPAAAKYTRREWHAVYTNQITQKAKKYQSGFLTLASCGSFQQQATLLTEDGTVLCREFLKLSENVRSGSSFQLPNYLVEVGELCESLEGEPPKLPSAERDEKSTFRPSDNSLKPGKSNPVDKPLHCGELPKDALSGRVLKSTLHPNAGSYKQGKNDPVDKPLRGANDILSILRKATAQQNILPAKSIPLEHCGHSQSPDCIHPQFQNHVGRDVGDSPSERHDADNHINGVLTSEDSEFRVESDCKYPAQSNFSMGEVFCDFSVLNSNGEHASKSILKPFSSAKEVKLAPRESQLLDNGYTEAFIESMFPKDATSCRSHGLPGELKLLNTNTFNQPDEKEMDIGKTSFEVCNNTKEMDDLPSFDLGF